MGAKIALERARKELSSNDDFRLRYAAIELRMVIESLVYERLQTYEKDVSGSKFDSWQPKKVMAFLLNVEPSADKDIGFEMRTDPEANSEEALTVFAGTEKVLSMQVIKLHYDALGNHLHVPTLKQQAARAEVDIIKLRGRCEDLLAQLTEILASRVWNLNIREYVSFGCARCGGSIEKRFSRKFSTVDVACLDCGAQYTLRDKGDQKVQIEYDGQNMQCANPDCKTPYPLWSDEIKPGTNWLCQQCGGHNELVLRLRLNPTSTVGGQ